MAIEGGCYCGAVRYAAEGEALFTGQCHCRECQYISGGGPNTFLGVPRDKYSYTKGSPQRFERSELEKPVIREFCAACGTHMVSHPPGVPMAIIKVGTLDDPSQFGDPQMAIYLCDKQSFHQVPEGVATFDRTPNG